MSTHIAAESIRALMSGKPGAAPVPKRPAAAADVPAVVLDGVQPVAITEPVVTTAAVPEPESVVPAAAPTLDAVDGDYDSAAGYVASNIAVRAAAAVQEWVETDDLDDGESLADRLLMSLVGIADGDQDGELDDDEQAVLQATLESVWDYLASKGVAEEDSSLLLNDWDDAAANRIRDLVAAALPEGDEAAAEDIDNFAFGDDDQEPALDAVYKKRMVIRAGQKVRINKRVSGHIRLSARQKVGIRKAQMKSHTAGAMMRRAKSMKKSRSMGLTK